MKKYRTKEEAALVKFTQLVNGRVRTSVDPRTWDLNLMPSPPHTYFSSTPNCEYKPLIQKLFLYKKEDSLAMTLVNNGVLISFLNFLDDFLPRKSLSGQVGSEG